MGEFKSQEKKRYDTTTILLFILLMVVSLLTGYVYLQLQQRTNEYILLYNRTTILEDYYENITMMYSEIRGEYEVLSENNRALIKNNYNMTILIDEYEEILTYGKELILVENESVLLDIKSNSSYVYEIPYSGYIVLNFTANDDIFIWIGSSIVDGIYYSRYPNFPETVESAEFIVPIAPDLYVFIGNPNEFNAVRVNFTIKFVY